MNTETEKLSPQQSLDLISEMISQAKGSVKHNSFYFLFWGWILLAANLGVFILIRINYPSPYMVWLITIPAWIITLVKGVRQAQHVRVSTHLDKINGVMWISYGVFALLMGFAFGRFINYQINAVLLLVGGLCVFVSGFIIRFKPVSIGGIVLFCAGGLCFFTDAAYLNLVAAAGVAFGYLVPGYLLKKSKV